MTSSDAEKAGPGVGDRVHFYRKRRGILREFYGEVVEVKYRDMGHAWKDDDRFDLMVKIDDEPQVRKLWDCGREWYELRAKRGGSIRGGSYRGKVIEPARGEREGA